MPGCSCLDAYCDPDFGVRECCLQALVAHSAAAAAADDPAVATEAREAALAALQCLCALASSASGMAAALETPGIMQRVAAALGGAVRRSRACDSDAARLAAEMLTNVCLFSSGAYRLVLQARS